MLIQTYRTRLKKNIKIKIDRKELTYVDRLKDRLKLTCSKKTGHWSKSEGHTPVWEGGGGVT